MAYAGTYSGPVYSGGEFTLTLSGGRTILDVPYGGTGPYGFSGGVPGTGHGFGAITATFTWVPTTGQTAATDPPPASVVVQEYCNTHAASTNNSLGGGPSPSVSCDNGLSGQVTTTQSTSGTKTMLYTECISTRFKVKSGSATVSLSCSPSAQGTGNQGGGAYVAYSASVYPVTVTLNGALADSSHNLNILVGQQCEGILNAGSCILSNFQWAVPGVTFDHFYISSDQSQGYPVFIDSSVWTTINPFWHWSSSGNYTVSATAQASINGQSIGQVTGQQSITVVTPLQTVAAVAGISSFETSNGTVTAIQAGPPGGAGMEINSVVTTPNPFTQYPYNQSGNYGSYYNVQLFKESRDINSGTAVFPFITNGFVLDSQDPYNGSQGAYEPGAANPKPLVLPDNPDQGIQYFNGVNIADEFKSYLMYLPPSNGLLDEQPVPIHLTQWNWTASAVDNGVWAPNPPGSCSVTSDGPSTEFPSWYASFTNKTGNTGRRTSNDPLYPFDMFSFYDANALGHAKY